MGAADPDLGAMGAKLYPSIPGGRISFVVVLFDAASGALSAVIEAGRLSGLRTGAASGVSVKHLAPPDVRSIGIIGTGLQARARSSKRFARCDLRRGCGCSRAIRRTCGGSSPRCRQDWTSTWSRRPRPRPRCEGRKLIITATNRRRSGHRGRVDRIRRPCRRDGHQSPAASGAGQRRGGPRRPRLRR